MRGDLYAVLFDLYAAHAGLCPVHFGLRAGFCEACTKLCYRAPLVFGLARAVLGQKPALFACPSRGGVSNLNFFGGSLAASFKCLSSFAEVSNAGESAEMVLALLARNCGWVGVGMMGEGSE